MRALLLVVAALALPGCGPAPRPDVVAPMTPEPGPGAEARAAEPELTEVVVEDLDIGSGTYLEVWPGQTILLGSMYYIVHNDERIEYSFDETVLTLKGRGEGLSVEAGPITEEHEAR